MIELRKITHDNFEAVLKLSITDEKRKRRVGFDIRRGYVIDAFT